MDGKRSFSCSYGQQDMTVQQVPGECRNSSSLHRHPKLQENFHARFYYVTSRSHISPFPSDICFSVMLSGFPDSPPGFPSPDGRMQSRDIYARACALFIIRNNYK